MLKWNDAESKRVPTAAARPPPRELTHIPYVVVLRPGTSTPSDPPYTNIHSPFQSEVYSPITDSEKVVATQRPGLLVFTYRRSEPFESFKHDTQRNRLVDFDYITLQMKDTICKPTECSDATVGVYTATYDPVLQKMGPYLLKTHTGMNVKVGRPEGRWVITVSTPDGDGDGKKTIGKSGESTNFCATVTRGEKGHYTNGGTLVFKYGPGWYGLEAVDKKKEDTSHIRKGDKAPYLHEKVGGKGPAAEPSGTRETEKGKASFSEKDGGWRRADGDLDNQSTNTPSQSVWLRLFAGSRRTGRLNQSKEPQ